MKRTSLALNRFVVYAFYWAVFMTRLLGAMSLSFDYKRQRFILQTKFQHLYCAVVHTLYLIILPLAVCSDYMQEAAYGQQKFFILLNVLITVLRLPALILTLAGTWLGRKNMFILINRFEALRLRYFHTLNEKQRNKILKRNDMLVILKMITSLSLMFTFYVRTLMVVEKPSLRFLLFTIYFGILEALCLFKMNFFFIGMCYANCILRYVRLELCEYERGVIKFPRIEDLIGIYLQTSGLVKRLTHIFQWEILSILFAGMVAMVSLFFNYIVWCQKNDLQQLSVYTCGFLFLGFLASLVNLNDVVLIAYICCNTIKCAKRIRDVLLVLHIQPQYQGDEVLQKEVSLYIKTEYDNLVEFVFFLFFCSSTSWPGSCH